MKHGYTQIAPDP